MDANRADAEPVQLIFHKVDDTPRVFVIELLRRVFGKSEREAIAFMASLEQQKKAACGPYPQSVANALLQAARQRIRAADHGLRITTELVKASCELCGQPAAKNEVRLGNRMIWLCSECMVAATSDSDELAE